MPNKLVVLLFLLSSVACGQSPTNIGSAVFPPDHITVQTGTPTIAVGQTATFTATLVLADGSSNVDETPNCSWSSSNNQVASFADPGLPVATGIAVGSVTITCTPQSNPLAITVNTATLTVSAAPIILTPPSPAFAMPAGTNGSPYAGYQLTASGGVLPYTWTISVGSLPTGLSLSSTGCGSNVNCQIGGTPTVNGTSNFTVKVTDSTPGTPLTATQTASITVSAAPCLSGLSYNPPTTYCSTTSTTADTWPTFAPSAYIGLTGTNNFSTETSTTGLGNGAWSVVRVSDSLSASQGSSTTSEGFVHAWSCQPVCNAGNYFFFLRTNNGGLAWYQFNAANFPSANPITWMGNVIGMSDGTQMSQDDKQWSFNKPNVIYTSGSTPSTSSYVAATIGYATVNLATAAPWTSSNFTHTVLLDPVNDVTNPCNGLGTTATGEWNKYLWSAPADNRITPGDSGGAGTNEVSTLYHYQSDNGRIIVWYDGTAPSGQRCGWVDSATAMISIHGAAAVPINGFGPIPPPAAPSVTLNTTGGTVLCPSSPANNISIEITYTILNVGETTPSPASSLSGGSGNNCSFTVSPPSSSPSLVGFTGVHPTGYNVYFCQGVKSTTCSSQANYTLVSALPNPASLTATCNVTTGSSTYSYTQVQVSSAGMTVPQPFVSTASNCANRLGASSPGTQVAVSSSKSAFASSIVVLRDFLTVGFQGLGGAFTDKGGSPTLFVVQTVPIANSETITQLTSQANNANYNQCSTCQPPTISTAGVNIHGNGLTSTGYITIAMTDAEKPNAKIAINTQTGNAFTLDLGNAGADVNPCDGHSPATTDWLFCIGTNLATLRFTVNDNPATVQASQFNFFNVNSLANPNSNSYTAYPDSRTDNYVLTQSLFPAPINYCAPGNSCAATSYPYDGETIGYPTNSATAPFRFFRSWSSGAGFNADPRGNISQDGKYFIFATDGLRNGTGSATCASTGACGFGGFSGNSTTAGCTPGASGNCRSEVMLVKLN